MLHTVRHADAFQRFLDALLPLSTSHATIRQGQFHVFVNRQIADQVERLKDKTDFAIPNSGTVAHLQGLNGFAIQDVTAATGGIEQSQNRQQGRLAATGWTGN